MRRQQGVGTVRTLANSHFKRAYDAAEGADTDYIVLNAVDGFLLVYFRHLNLSVDQARQFLAKLREEGYSAAPDGWFKEGMSDVGGFAQRLWSSTTPGPRSRELCTMINDALRLDEPEMMTYVAIFARTLNAGLVTRRNLPTVPWPPTRENDGVTATFRGAILPVMFLAFYLAMKGCKYRVPGFLATSFSQEVATEFAMRASQAANGKEPAVCYEVRVHPEGKTRMVRRCQHVGLIRKSNKPEEQEFLYVPYSAFTVLDVRLSPNPTWQNPHVVVLEAAIDNICEPEDLPLAPWY